MYHQSVDVEVPAGLWPLLPPRRPLRKPGQELDEAASGVKENACAGHNGGEINGAAVRPKTASPQTPKTTSTSTIDGNGSVVGPRKLDLRLLFKKESHNFADFLAPASPRSRNLKESFMSAKVDFVIEKLAKPIGISLLVDGNIAIGVTGENAVKIFNPTGKYLKMIKPGRPFIRPSDMVTMADGRLAVRDNGGIQLFDDEGVFLGHVGQGRLGKCYGLSTDGKGSLITLNQKFQRGAPTAHVEVMVINVETDKVTKEISLGSIITDMTKSKCRFLHHRENKLYVVDLGLDVVYVIDMIMLEVDTFGGTGTKNGLFLDPAGIVVDDQGYMIVADSRNHKLKVFSNHREYKGQVMTLDRPLKRPSGIVASLDSDSEPALYVLNLWGHNMVKYILQRK